MLRLAALDGQVANWLELFGPIFSYAIVWGSSSRAPDSSVTRSDFCSAAATGAPFLDRRSGA